MFTWIPIHKETIEKIIKDRIQQGELLNILHAMKAESLKVIPLIDKDEKSKKIPLEEIDPFTFFSNFNRGVTHENRRNCWSFLKRRWGLSADIPQDFEGIPIVNNMKSWFFPRAFRRNQGNIPLLWKLATASAANDLDHIDRRLFSKSLELRGISLNMLSIGLFWLNPGSYLPCDKKTVRYGVEKGVTIHPQDFDTYRQWMNEMTEALGRNFPEISLAAHLFAVGKSKNSPEIVDGPRYWTVGTGEHGSHWNEFYEKGIMAIGFDPSPDLRQFKSLKEIQKQLKRLHPGKGSKKNDSLGLWQFVHDMKPGDIIFAKKGSRTLFGCGIVAGQYSYDADQPKLKHVTKVRWLSQGEWKVPAPHKMAIKTLTDISSSRSLVETLAKLCGVPLDLHEVSGRKSINPHTIGGLTPDTPAYTKEMAMVGLFFSTSEFDDMLEALREKKNIVLQGPPGVGKTYIADRLAYTLIGVKDQTRIERIQFHQSYSYEDFIQGYRPTGKGFFDLKRGIFHRFCLEAQREETSGRPYVFIIDEINRGNLSKIFGELMMLIEPDKRGKGYAMSLPYSDDSAERFYVPENLHLIGTMNTADRSLAMVDYALRRRFRFLDLNPAFETKAFSQFLESKGVTKSLITKIVNRMNALNAVIDEDKKNLGPGYRIGHSYFCPTDGMDPNDEWYRRIIKYEVLPMIQEYWFDDEQKVSKHRAELLAD